jgi:hypothetical protein
MKRILQRLLPILLLTVCSGQMSLAQSIDTTKAKSDCQRCIDGCKRAESFSEQKGGKFADQDHIRHIKDCINACTSSADFLNRGSGLSKDSAKMTIDACNKCATSCESMGGDTLKACADDCRRLAESLKKVSLAEKP